MPIAKSMQQHVLANTVPSKLLSTPTKIGDLVNEPVDELLTPTRRPLRGRRPVVRYTMKTRFASVLFVFLREVDISFVSETCIRTTLRDCVRLVLLEVSFFFTFLINM